MRPPRAETPPEPTQVPVRISSESDCVDQGPFLQEVLARTSKARAAALG